MKRFTVILLFVLLLFVLSPVRSNFVEFGFRSVDIPQPPPPTNFDYQPKIRAVDVMVDITNDLSYRILQQHSIANRNNFAFSPTSLTSVLIALYEGSQGGGATQVYNVLKLPWNRDLLRIGYRDIHRRLRKYFFNEENPLTGLTLSRENVTITSQYEDILVFYGYDLRTDMHPFNDLSPAQSTTTATPKAPESTTSTTESTTESTTTSTTESTTSKSEESTTTSPSTTTTTTETSPTTTTTNEQTTTSIEASSPVAAALLDVETTTAPEDTSDPSEITTVTTTSATIDEEISTIAADYSTTTLDEESTTVEPDTTTTVETTTPTSARLVNTIDPNNMLFPLSRNRRPTRNRPSMLHREGRVKRQYPLFYENQPPPPPPPPFTITVTPIRSPIQPPISDFHFVRLDNNNADDNLNVLYEPKRDTTVDKKEIYHIFYLNAQETIQARYKVFNTILRFSYIQNIRSSVLALELDSPDYELLIMIPDYNFGLDFLLQGLKSAPTLRVIRQEMRPRWVQAIVPDFKLKGNIFLTNDLQNMGILEVFEPTRADFSPMTNESDIYVKHIEQKINVHLRTRPIDQMKKYVGPYNRPIEVSVNHPFLFFIVDKELDVAIMAGRVLNPLNIRIH